MPVRRMAGLGDLVHATLHPMVKIVDKVFKTDLQHCEGCNTKRRQRLNKAVPFR